MGNIDQLVKKYPKSPSGYRDVNPNTFTDVVKDRKTKETLEALISRNNFIHLPYIGSKENTRLQLDIKFRRKGLWVGYITHDKKIVVEYYNNDNIENEYWKDDLYWIPYSEALNISLNEEDLSYTSRGIEFANRDTTQGMGRIIIRRGKPILEQFSQANTIYEICYDFDLKGNTLEIPDNCILDFSYGGTINNGTIKLNNCMLYPLCLNPSKYITAILQGSYANGQVIYNATEGRLELRHNGSWVNVDGSNLN